MGGWEARCELTMDILVWGIRSEDLGWMRGWGILTEKSSVDFLPTSQAHHDATYLEQLGAIATLLTVHPFASCTPSSFWGPWLCAWHSNPPVLAASLFYKFICFYAPSCLWAPSQLNDSLFPNSPMLLHSVPLLTPAVFQVAFSFLPPCAQILHVLSGLMHTSPLHKVMPPPHSGSMLPLPLLNCVPLSWQISYSLWVTSYT